MSSNQFEEGFLLKQKGSGFGPLPFVLNTSTLLRRYFKLLAIAIIIFVIIVIHIRMSAMTLSWNRRQAAK